MTFDDLADSGRLRKDETGKDKIAEFLQFAKTEVEAARYLFPKYRAVAYKSAYDALIHAGNALIRHYGYRPTDRFTHATITECTDRILGKEYGALVGRFKRMRRKRHPLQYEASFVESETEVLKSIDEAAELIKRIEEHIGVKPRQSS
ncbi:MAG: hypothetical protein QME66_02785 [Candidatus Eisenbacteria bacterium]|nr:hypothetical protein [Candidatus Eisenbacteria bacterium]